MLFSSLNKLKKEVSPSVRIYPAHGSGSSCGKSIGEGNFCTFEKQLGKNYALKIDDEQEFTKAILSEMPKPPSYFFHDASLNQKGIASKFEEMLQKSLRALSVKEFSDSISAGARVIDSRKTVEKSVKNSLLMSENGNIATWVGTLLSPQTQILLLCESEQKAKDLIERLFRIGYFNIIGYNGFTLDQW